jgi:hypothetical protein
MIESLKEWAGTASLDEGIGYQLLMRNVVIGQIGLRCHMLLEG